MITTALTILGALAAGALLYCVVLIVLGTRAGVKAFLEAPRRHALPERMAFIELLKGIRAGTIREPTHLWIYDPTQQMYLATDAEGVRRFAKVYGTVKVVRYDAELQEFSEATVTADMPLAEIAE